jgi:hypothetical protein
MHDRALSPSWLICVLALCACGGDDQSDGPGPDDVPDPGSCRQAGLPCADCPADTFCWDHPSTLGGTLNAVSASDDSNVWVSSDSNSLSWWNGEEWRNWYLPEGENVQGISAVPGGAWLATTAGLYVFAEQRWSRKEVPAEITVPSLVSGISTSQTWIAGSLDAALLDGTWTVHSVFDSITDLYAPSVTEAFTVGQTMKVRHLAGEEWTTENVDGAPPLFGLTGSGPDDVWVMDSRDTPELRLHHWNGVEWSDQEGPGGQVRQGFSALGGTVWIPGRGGTIYTCGAGAPCAADAPLGNFQGAYPFADDLAAVAMTESGGWAVGSSGGYVLRLDREVGWGAVTPAPDADMSWVVSPAPGTVWVNGARELHQRTEGAWTRHGPTGPPLLAGQLFVESAESVWCAFDHRGLWRHDGTEWTMVSSDAAIDDATSVFASGEDVWVITNPGNVVLRRVDGTWTPVDTGMSVSRIWGRSSSAMYLVGTGNDSARLVLHDGNAAYQPIDIGAGKITNSFEQADGAIWLLLARDAGQAVVKVTGTSAQEIASMDLDHASHIWAAGDDDVWVTGRIGNSNLARHWDGASWTTFPTLEDGSIASDGTDVFIAAGTGVLRLQRAP